MRKFFCVLLAALMMCTGALAWTGEVGKTFNDGLTMYKEGDKYGFINTQGDVVIPAQYLQGAAFHNGYALVNVGSKNNSAVYHYIDTTGTVVGKPVGSKGSTQYFALAEDSWFGDYGIQEKWQLNAKKKSFEPAGYQYVTAKGKLLVNQLFTHVTPFDEEGYAVVGTGKLSKKGTRIRMNGTLMIAYLEGNNPIDASTSFWFINQKGKQLGKTKYTTAPHNFSEGLAAVPGTANAKGVSKWGYIDNQGKVVIDYLYTTAGDFKNGRARVCENGKWGYIDASGSPVIPLEWDAISEFSEGRASVKKGELCGYVDESGRLIGELKWASADSFSSARGRVKEAGEYGKTGYTDLNGNPVIEPVYDEARSFRDGYAAVSNGIAWGVIDLDGNLVVPMAYASINVYDHGVFAATELTVPMIVDENGSVVTIALVDGALPTETIPDGTPVHFIAFPEMENGLQLGCFTDEKNRVLSMNISAAGVKEGSYQIRNGSGLTAVWTAENGQMEGLWEEVFCTMSGDKVILRVKKDGLYGYADQHGKMMTPVEYTDAGTFGDGATIVVKGGEWFILNDEGVIVF